MRAQFIGLPICPLIVQLFEFIVYACQNLAAIVENYYYVILNNEDMILGVSGWVGEKMGFTEQQVRIAFVVGFFLFGVGIGLYLILWLVKMFS